MQFPQVYEINEGLLNRIVDKCWPERFFNKITEQTEIKSFYNSCYLAIKSTLDARLEIYHPAVWIICGYGQLDIWTAVYQGAVEGPTNIAPAARYGWRYIVERSLERIKTETQTLTRQPTQNEIQDILTLIVGAVQVTEISNYLHYLRENFRSISIKFGPFILNSFPALDQNEEQKFDLVKKYFSKKCDPVAFREFFPSKNVGFIKQLNGALIDELGFNLELVYKLIQAVCTICATLKASVIVYSLDNFIDLISLMTKINKSVVEKMVRYTFLDTRNPSYQNRDFLRKSQPVRLLNYAGIILELDKYHEAIYDPQHLENKEIISSKYHVIIGGGILAEWFDIFPAKVAFGQREDLKNVSETTRSRLSHVESYFTRKVFETEVKKIFERNGFSTITIKDCEGREIECGEIDILAYHKSKQVLMIVECKAHSPIVDARYIGQIVNDHFRQKKYHSKFLRKIEWVRSNPILVAKAFKENHSSIICEGYKFKSFFITWSGSIIKFLVDLDDYEVLTFDELEMKLNQNEY